MRRALTAVERALCDGAAVGLAVGVLDALRVLGRAGWGPGGGLGGVVVVLGLCALGGLVVGGPVVLALRGLGHHPLLAALGRRLGQPGPPRVAALVGVVGGVLALLAFAIVTALTVLVVTPRYHARGPAAAVTAAVVVAAGLVIALVATALLPWLGRWLGGRTPVVALTRGRRGAATAGLTALAAAVAVHGALARLAPTWDAGPTELLTVAGLGLVVVATSGVAVRLDLRRARVALGVAALLAASGLVTIGRADHARGAISAHGVASGQVLRGLWRATDGDGDGFGARFGAHDCDDGDPTVHPHAVDRAGDGVDGNCAGGDPAPAAVAAARVARPSTTPAAPRHDIVIVTIDSLRADHTSVAGYRWPTTPNLAALAARGVHFERAYTPSPTTRRAVPALHYGRMPSTLPFTRSKRYPLLLDNALPTLATTLTAAGYRTAAILSHRGLPLGPATYRGFTDVIALSDEPVSRHRDNADQVIDRALAWLAEPDPRPRLVWMHLIDPHYPYRPLPAAPALGPGVSAYDREIAFVDVQLGRLFAALSADRTIFVVSADHGEAFGEHHVRFHGKSLDEGEARIPLVVVAPGGPAVTAAGPASLLDVAPTVLDLVGVETPAGMTGTSWAGLVRGGPPPPPRPLLLELFENQVGGRELLAVVDGDRKLVRDLSAWTVAGFDLAADPGERAPLSDSRTLDELVRTLDATVDRELAAPP